MVFRLVHRTDYDGGDRIDPSEDLNYGGLHLVWTQATWRKEGCCRGFGERVVEVLEDNFQLEAPRWNLYHATNDNAAFLNFILTPFEYDEDELRFIDVFRSHEILDGLETIMKRLLRRQTGGFVHFHIGLEIDQVWATADALNGEYNEQCARDAEIDRLIQEAIRQKEEDEYYERCARDAEIDRLIGSNSAKGGG